MPDDPVGISEIARRAGTSPGMVRNWRRRHADFPAPIAELAMGPVFDWPPVAAWLAKPRPMGRPPKRVLEPFYWTVPGVLVVKRLGRGRRKTFDIPVDDVGAIVVRGVVKIGDELLRVMAIRPNR